MNRLGETLLLLVLVAAFAGILWWAFGPARKRRFEQDGEMPFNEPD
jgi:cbb3-type cytochrome oxidase subunit 3